MTLVPLEREQKRSEQKFFEQVGVRNVPGCAFDCSRFSLRLAWRMGVEISLVNILFGTKD